MPIALLSMSRVIFGAEMRITNQSVNPLNGLRPRSPGASRLEPILLRER